MMPRRESASRGKIKQDEGLERAGWLAAERGEATSMGEETTFKYRAVRSEGGSLEVSGGGAPRESRRCKGPAAGGGRVLGAGVE